VRVAERVVLLAYSLHSGQTVINNESSDEPLFASVLHLYLRPPAEDHHVQWTNETEKMQVYDYQEALHNFASFAFDNPARGLLVDVREVRYRPAVDLGNWRGEVISPRYVKAGVKRERRYEA